MMTYEGSWYNLWKQARHPGSKVYPIKNIKDLELYLGASGNIHLSVGDGNEFIDKKMLYNSNFEYLTSLIQKGIVFVEETYDKKDNKA